jgi:hypothetical protein
MTQKTLVIILAETRASQLTFTNFKENVIDHLNADLCVCIGVKNDYDYNNPFYNLAKYRFCYNEPDDFAVAFEYAFDEITKNKPKYEKLDNFNSIYGKLQYPTQSTKNIIYYKTLQENETLNVDNIPNANEIVIHTNNFFDNKWKNQVYIVNGETNNNDGKEQDNVITYKKPLHWREFLKIKNQFMGGIKDPYNQHDGSAGILIFFRWYLLQKLIENDLIDQYNRFIITRSDFLYQLPHPKMEQMNENFIWIPDCEHYGGFTDRHTVLSKNNIQPYLNILENMVLQSNEYYLKMKDHQEWNLEKLIKFHLKQNNILHLVKEFPYIMYSVRAVNGTTRWMEGVFSKELGYYVKYPTEYTKSNNYKKEFDDFCNQKQQQNIDDFYLQKISIRKNYNCPKTPIQIAKLNPVIIADFMEDLQIICPNSFANGVISNSQNQIPNICKKYMNYSNGNYKPKWTKEMIDEMLECCDNKEYHLLSPDDYPKSSLQFVKVFENFVNVANKDCLVLGSISPWVECLLLHFGAKSVSTMDYVAPECNYKINILQINGLNNIAKYDVVVSYSSLEHDGLGRYGDPINPNGDIDACIEAYSLLKNNGYFICGIPIGDGFIEGNYHRIYNKKRVNKLFSLFGTLIGSVNYLTFDDGLNYSGKDWQNQPIFIYKK